MPLPKNRSTSVRKIHKRTPKGRTVHYRRRVKGGRHSCGLCGAMLQAVNSHASLSSSARAPNRKFGGNLCTGCASRVMVVSLRLKEKAISRDDVEVRMLKYITG